MSVGAEVPPKGWAVAGKTGYLSHDCYNHAAALNYAYEDTSAGITILVDCDICVLYHGWDQLVVNQCRRSKVFGTAYRKGANYQNFPNVFFFAFPIELKNVLDLDFIPSVSSGESPDRVVLSSSGQAKRYGKKAGDQLKCDTGYRIADQCYKAGIEGVAMECIEQTDKRSQLPYVNDRHREMCLEKPTHMAEWHYDGKLFCTHKQASRNHPLDGEYGKAWKQKIDEFTMERDGAGL